MRRLLAPLTAVALFLACLPAAAQEAPPPTVWVAPVITPVVKGTIVPFSGVLLTPEAVARIVADAKDCPLRSLAEAERARAEERARGQKSLDDIAADAKHDREVARAAIDQRDAAVKDLTARLAKSEQASSATWLWAGGGLLAGALLVTLSIVAVGSVR